MTFNEEHASTGELRIWDVEKHLKHMNDSCGNVADAELTKFIQGSKELANLIKAEISGSRGEFTVFTTLKNLQIRNVIIKNLEICEDEYHTEIDGIVITPTGIAIIEVKNSAKDIYIDEKGNYYRIGNYNKLDCNIADKMRVREQAVSDILEKAGFDNIRVSSIVVFTNTMIEVSNRCDNIKAVFVGQLPGVIENIGHEQNISVEMMKMIADCLRNKAYVGQYHVDMDIEKYKKDFATLMTKLEEASCDISEQEQDETPAFVGHDNSVEMTSKVVDANLKKSVWKKWLLPVGKVLGTVAISTVTTLVVNTILGRRD